jgi:hypothetical protein
MNPIADKNTTTFSQAVKGLRAGDFSRLAPLFDEAPGGARCRIVEWNEAGMFASEPTALDEALSCACFLGCTSVAEYLLDHGVIPSAGNGTGMDAFHWAVNRGQFGTTMLLIRRKTPLEVRSSHGGTVLGTAVWSAIHEPRRDHLKIIEALVAAGARVDEIELPTGRSDIDDVLRNGR